MKEVKRRKAHLPEFKAKVGLEALRGEKTVNQIGQEYGIHPVQVGQWKKEIQAQAKTLFEGRRGQWGWRGWRRDPTPAGPAGRTRSTRSIPICCAG